MQLLINPLAVIFCPRIDEQNGFETIVQNPITGEVFKIDKKGYQILQQVFISSGIDDLIIKSWFGGAKFLEKMITENVIIPLNH